MDELSEETISMDAVIVARGSGYKDCTAFDGYEVIAQPLGGRDAAGREKRILGRVDDKPGTGCDYSSHVIQLAIRPNERPYKGSRELFILMHHGGGRVVYRMKQMYDGGVTERALLALPEAALYGILYTMVEMVDNADQHARKQTEHEWATAFDQKRIRIRRSRGRRTISIESAEDKALRTGA